LERDLENPASSPALETVGQPDGERLEQPAGEVGQVPAEADEKIGPVAWLDDTGIQIVRATRSWVQYGTLGFAVVCIIIGAVEALFGK